MSDHFTIEKYRRYARLAIAERKVVSFATIDWSEPFVVWRHDCDMSLVQAERIAEIDADLGIRSTFFVNLKSEYYNPFENSQRQIIARMARLGHDIGVHLDTSAEPSLDREALLSMLSREIDIVSHLAGCRPTAFSFHNPTPRDLATSDDVVLGLVNCYSRRFREEVSYCSDSNGYWRYWSLETALHESRGRKLQVLTHPEWWLDEPLPPRTRVLNAVYGQADRVMATYDRQMKELGRENLSLVQMHEPRFDSQKDGIARLEFLWSRGWHDLAAFELLRLEGSGGTLGPDLDHTVDRLGSAKLKQISAFLEELRHSSTPIPWKRLIEFVRSRP